MNEVELVPEERGAVSAMVEAEKTHSAQRIQAALVIAQKFPRNELKAEQRILEACQRFDFAEKAQYAYPKGGKTVRGPSIRFAEMMARYWGNMKYGFREIEQIEGRSTVEAFCWDLETNTEATRTFVVNHSIAKKSGDIKNLTDPREIYEMTANMGQRRVRACIEEVIPSHIVNRALEEVTKTLKKGDKAMSRADIFRWFVTAFQQFGVTVEHLEKRLKHKLDECNEEEIVDLRAIYRSLKDGEQKREAWFDFGGATTGGKAETVADKFTSGATNKNNKTTQAE